MKLELGWVPCNLTGFSTKLLANLAKYEPKPSPNPQKLTIDPSAGGQGDRSRGAEGDGGAAEGRILADQQQWRGEEGA